MSKMCKRGINTFGFKCLMPSFIDESNKYLFEYCLSGKYCESCKQYVDNGFDFGKVRVEANNEA